MLRWLRYNRLIQVWYEAVRVGCEANRVVHMSDGSNVHWIAWVRHVKVGPFEVRGSRLHWFDD